MATYSQTAGCNSPHDWLVSLAMDLLLCVICGGKNGPNGCHLAGFSKDRVLAHHFVATHPPPTLSPCRSATGIGYTSKKLSKMA